eukprot:m.54478 g.54478  ORF g.54478 m.54478 type:complete len:126 (+) comp10929_c0_seq2:299-676(+)
MDDKAQPTGDGSPKIIKANPTMPEVITAWFNRNLENPLPYPQISKTPCMRDAFLNGIGAAFPIGLLTFLHTKVVIQGCRAAVASCVVIGLGTWEFCRYQHKKRIETVKRTVEELNRDQLEGGPEV